MHQDRKHLEDWDEFYECIADLDAHPALHRLEEYIQHAHVTRYDHSVNVAYQSYRWAKHLGLDARAAARGGMLHDLFFYDWQEKGAAPGPGCHARWHPYYALQTAKKHFSLTPKEENIIVSHMFPLGYELPHYKESFIVTWADKICALQELTQGLRVLLALWRMRVPLLRGGRPL